MRITYQDAIDHLVDYLGGNPSEAVQRDCRRAVQAAYRDLANAFHWSYYLAHGRIITSGPFLDGTIAYDHTGGTFERQCTLTDATWPAWVLGAYLRTGQVAYKIVRRISDTVVLFDEQVNPGQDIDAGTAHKTYRDTYLLPADFIAQDQALYERNFGGMGWVHPREWLFENRFVFAEGTPQCFTITGDPLWPDRLVMKILPFPSEAKSIDFLYQRRPRPLSIAEESAGTLTVASGSDSVTGSGTALSVKMIGSVVRLGSATVAPSGSAGLEPAAFEAAILDVGSATALTLTDPADATYTGVKFTISDPIDIEDGAMANAFLRAAEAQIAINRTLKDKPSARNQYAEALEAARSADSRNFSGRSCGDRVRPYRQRLRDMPIDLTRTE